MKKFLLLSILFLSISQSWAILEDPQHFEESLHENLKASIIRVIPQEQFQMTVNARFKDSTKRKLTHQEHQFKEQAHSNPTQRIEPLPGLQVPTNNQAQNTEKQQEGRSIYETEQKHELQQIYVQLNVDKEVSESSIQEVRKIVSQFLTSSYGKLAKFQLIKSSFYKPPGPVKDPAPFFQKINTWAVLGTLIFLLSLLLFYLYKRKKIKNNTSVTESQISPFLSRPENSQEEGPAITAQKSEWHKLICDSPGQYRTFLNLLTQTERDELNNYLHGPALKQIYQMLQVPLSESGTSGKRKMDFFKSAQLLDMFKEFISIAKWQKDQFFGFLSFLSLNQLHLLFQNLAPKDIALCLKNLDAQTTAQVLDQVDLSRRRVLLELMTKDLDGSIENLLEREGFIRRLANELPENTRRGLASREQGWEAILKNSQKQKEIYLTLLELDPQLKKNLSMYSLSWEDLSVIPEDTLVSAIERMDNDVLAQALVSSDPFLREQILALIPTGRKSLIEGQLRSLRSSEHSVSKQVHYQEAKEKILSHIRGITQ